MSFLLWVTRLRVHYFPPSSSHCCCCPELSVSSGLAVRFLTIFFIDSAQMSHLNYHDGWAAFKSKTKRDTMKNGTPSTNANVAFSRSSNFLLIIISQRLQMKVFLLILEKGIYCPSPTSSYAFVKDFFLLVALFFKITA